ncbi:hypothetical protein N8D56_21385 [Devosia sp. A8/3-2]|nr:hypothetical protein N8D56_21385 [Devosia sp. A8/3-2]
MSDWLVACECSGAIRARLRDRGVNARSCDIKPAEDGSRFHIQADVMTILNHGWGGMIAHPECRFLCGSGLHWNARGKMVDGRPRAELTAEALTFAIALWNAPIERVAVENSVGILSRPENLGKASQIVQPYELGDDASKATCWWFRGINPIRIDPAARCPGRLVEWPIGSGKIVERWSNQTDSGQNRLGPSASRSADRARTYPGIADGLVDAVLRTIAADALRSAA